MWVPSPGGIARIDPATGDVKAIPIIGAAPTDLLATDDAVWVTDKHAGRVIRVDPATNPVVAEIDTGGGAHDLAIDDHGGVWVTNYQANTVSHIDAATNEVVATIEGVGSGVGITAGGGMIWVSTRVRGISQIHPITHETVLVTQFMEWNYGIAYGDDELWTTSVDEELVYRIYIDDVAHFPTHVDIARAYQAGSIAAAAAGSTG